MSEAYAKARNATNLSHNAEKIMPVDWLGAAGAAGQYNHLGSLLMAAQAEHDGSGMKSITRNALIEAVLEEARGRGVGHLMAFAVLQWWLEPVCDDCHGRGFELIPGAPKLSDVACPSCKGSGKREIPGGELGADFAELLDVRYRTQRGALMRRMG